MCRRLVGLPPMPFPWFPMLQEPCVNRNFAGVLRMGDPRGLGHRLLQVAVGEVDQDVPKQVLWRLGTAT
jgi:hypothetical protein